MKCAIVGLGDFGRAAAIGLPRAGTEVIAIDRNMDRLNLVKDEVALAIRMDATHREALEAQGVAKVVGVVTLHDLLRAEATFAQSAEGQA